MANSKEIKEEYTSSLADLTFNSKPLISVLTMLAEEYSQHAKDIVEAIETHLTKVRTEVKLPVLYLIDCIIKNVGGPYLPLFCQNIVPTFCSVFESVDEKTRAEMFKLRQTWNDVIPAKKLYALDVQISMLDPAWPVTAPPPNNSIHLNPKFLMNSSKSKSKKEATTVVASTAKAAAPVATNTLDPTTLDMQQQLLNKQKQLLELQQKKLELELLQTKVKLQESMKNTNPVVVTSNKPVVPVTTSQNLLLKPEVAKQMVTTKLSPKANVVGTSGKPKTTAIVSAAAGSLGQKSQGVPPTQTVSSSVPKQTRDPRLLRQQHNSKQTNIVNSNVQLESKPPQIDSNNKNVNSKMSVRDNNRTEPRTSTVKDDNNPAKPQSHARTHNKSRNKIPRIPKTSDNSTGSPSKGSTSSPDSKLSKIGTSSPAKSSPTSKNKKKDKLTAATASSAKTCKNDLSSAFKEVKMSTKNRNYMRRNRKKSISPEPDVDLRRTAPEKVKALLDSSEEKSYGIDEGRSMDTDLRQLPVISKKRASSEHTGSPDSKKLKTQMFDVLFGNEDTDLRQLPVAATPLVDRPPTPPPPIISSQPATKEVDKKSELDVVRAKLANATGKGLSTFTPKVDTTPDPKKPDTDLRNLSPSKRRNQIIISPADAQSIQTGNMTKEQEKALMNKIIAQIETRKLREAQRKESETNAPNSDEDLNGASDEDDRQDKDERVPPVHSGDEFHQKFPRMGGERGRVMLGRRGARRRGGFDGLFRGGARPWQHGPEPWGGGRGIGGPWRPMGPSQAFVRPQHFVDENTMGNSPNAYQGDSDLVMDSSHDNHKMINIDGVPRDIRYYDDKAVIFLNWDDPRDISFQNGDRTVSFDDEEFFVLNFNEPYREVKIKGNMHKIKLGGPTRELFIDGKFYECIFGGSPIAAELNGKICMVKLEGPPPQVKIGNEKRTDIVCGKINLIIDAKTIVPVFLDATVQKFEVNGRTHTLRFKDSLKTALIDDMPFKVEYGGLPRPVILNNKKHFVRFSVLPRDIRPGHVQIKDMENTTESSESPVPPSEDTNLDTSMDTTEPILPVLPQIRKLGDESPDDRNSSSPSLFQTIMQNQNISNLDVLSSVMSSAMASTGREGEYQVENGQETHESIVDTPTATVPPEAPVTPVVERAPPIININELFQKLVATGIVTTGNDKPVQQPVPIIQPPIQPQNSRLQPQRRQTQYIPQPQQQQLKPSYPTKNYLMNMKRVSFAEPETLRVLQPQVFQRLYAGMQCSSCGMRFPPEQSMLYSQHLDWHFRQNRKGKKNIRKAASRRWYYSLEDWKNYEEIEDLEEREKNFFDQQQSQADGTGEEMEEETEIPTVPADPDVQDARCELCQDQFEMFYNEEKEEWQLRMAMRMNDKIYHPLCYEDYQASLNVPIDISSADVKELEKLEEKEKLIPGLEIVLDDDDEEMKPADEPQETASEATAEEAKEEESEEKALEEEDDDVIIHEVVPEKIVLDDDDDGEENMGQMANVVIKQEPIDDGFMDVTGVVVKMKVGEIKTEPTEMDLDADVSLPQEPSKPDIDTTHTELVSSMDGNVELDVGPTAPPPSTGIGGRIRINISKSLPPPTAHKEQQPAPAEPEDAEPRLPRPPVGTLATETFIDPSQPLPPGEEPVQLNVKPALRGLELRKMPTVRKGSELTGLCCVM